jgi:hypothetical protein
VTNVFFGHTFRREALLEAGPDATAINLANLGDRLHGLHFALNDEAAHFVLQHLRH